MLNQPTINDQLIITVKRRIWLHQPIADQVRHAEKGRDSSLFPEKQQQYVQVAMETDAEKVEIEF